MADEEQQADGQQGRQEPVPDAHLIQDFDHYLRTHGLTNEEPQYGAFQSQNNRAESQRRVDESNAYQDEIHQRLFAANDEEEKQNELPRKEILNALSDGQRITLHSSDGSVEGSLRLLASTCETIFSLVASRNLFQRSSEQFEFTLDAFPRASVEEFIELVKEVKPIHEANPDHVVDCCQIAHYLQCLKILDPIVEVLVRSVDTDNCMSLAQLADRLDLPVLFERSLSHMMFSLHEVEENSDIWDNVSKELKDRIQLIQAAIKTSIHGGGRTNLYFASLQEYLAIFAEQVDYHKERLADAKKSQDRVARDRLSWRNWKYAEEKIAKQEERVNTMIMVMKEQKKMFAAKDAHLRIDDLGPRTV